MVGSLFAHIKRALDEEDIEGLFALRAPPDEYEEEARMIHDRICKVRDAGPGSLNPMEVLQIIEEVWESEFGPLNREAVALRKLDFERLAARISDAVLDFDRA